MSMQQQKLFQRLRLIFHTILLIATAIYVLWIPFGAIKSMNRLKPEEIVLLGILLLISSQLLDSITDLTINQGGISAKFKQLEAKQDKQKKQLAYQQTEIRSLQVALQGIVTRFELEKLLGLNNEEEPFLCKYSNDLHQELKHLRAMGLIRNHEGVSLSNIKGSYGENSQKFDLKSFFYITEQGKEYLNLRSEII